MKDQIIKLSKLNDKFNHINDVELWVTEWLDNILDFKECTIPQERNTSQYIECALMHPGPNGKKSIKIEVNCQGTQNLFIEAQPPTKADINIFINIGWTDIYQNDVKTGCVIEGKIHILSTDTLRELTADAETITKHNNTAGYKVASSELTADDVINTKYHNTTGYEVAPSPPTDKNPHTLPHLDEDDDGWVASIGADRTAGQWEYNFTDVYDPTRFEQNATRVKEVFRNLGYLY